MKKGILGTIQYIPDLNRNERINIGVVLHYPNDEKLQIEFIKKHRRLKEFDDEINIEFYELYTNNIKKEFTFSITNPLSLDDYDLVRDLSYNYVNQYQFIIEDVVITDEFSVVFEEFKKLKLHYDYDKNERLTNKQKFDIISKGFLRSGVNISRVKQKEVIGNFEESLNFDFKVENTYIKIFEFKESNYKQLVNQIKIWIYNSKHYKDNINLSFIVIDEVNNKITLDLKQHLKETNEHVFDSIDDSKLITYLNKQVAN